MAWFKHQRAGKNGLKNDRGTIAKLDVTNQVIARRWTGHQALVEALALSPNG